MECNWESYQIYHLIQLSQEENYIQVNDCVSSNSLDYLKLDRYDLGFSVEKLVCEVNYGTKYFQDCRLVTCCLDFPLEECSKDWSVKESALDLESLKAYLRVYANWIIGAKKNKLAFWTQDLFLHRHNKKPKEISCMCYHTLLASDKAFHLVVVFLRSYWNY